MAGEVKKRAYEKIEPRLTIKHSNTHKNIHTYNDRLNKCLKINEGKQNDDKTNDKGRDIESYKMKESRINQSTPPFSYNYTIQKKNNSLERRKHSKNVLRH